MGLLAGGLTFALTKSRALSVMLLVAVTGLFNVQGAHYGVMVDTEKWSVTAGKARHVEWDERYSVEIRPLSYLPWGPELKIEGPDFAPGVTVVQTNNRLFYMESRKIVSSVTWTVRMKSYLRDVMTVADPDGEFNVGLRDSVFEDWAEVHRDLKERGKRVIVIGDCCTNLGHVHYVEVRAEPVKGSGGYHWRLYAELGICAECPVSEASCIDGINKMCFVGDNYWDVDEVYGLKFTRMYMGTVPRSCKRKRTSHTYMKGWICGMLDSQPDSKISRGHILPHKNGGEFKGYNCMVVTKEENTNATGEEAKLTGGQWFERRIVAREAPAGPMFVMYKELQLLDWRTACFCGWDFVSMPPTCALYGEDTTKNQSIIVVSANKIKEAKLANPARQIVGWATSCLITNEELLVKDAYHSPVDKIVKLYRTKLGEVFHWVGAIAAGIWNPYMGGGTAVSLLTYTGATETVEEIKEIVHAGPTLLESAWRWQLYVHALIILWIEWYNTGVLPAYSWVLLFNPMVFMVLASTVFPCAIVIMWIVGFAEMVYGRGLEVMTTIYIAKTTLVIGLGKIKEIPGNMLTLVALISKSMSGEMAVMLICHLWKMLREVRFTDLFYM